MMFRRIPPHVIALDLDGTLLTDDKTIDKPTKRYLRHLEKHGHIVTIATGRPLRAIRRYYDSVGLHAPVICYNGACLTNPHDEKFPERAFAFPKEVVLDILETVGRQHIENIMCETNKKIWLMKEDTDLAAFFWHDDMQIIYGDLATTLDENPMTMIIKSAVRGEHSDQLLHDAVKRHDKLCIRFWNRSPFSEIYYDYISKGHAILEVADHYDIPHTRVLAFGDAENDLEMLAMAGVGFAMLNGTEATKQHADIVTKYSNNENGILHALKRYFRTYSR